MTSARIRRFRLQALAGFRCLAGDCPDTCCANWTVELDPPTRTRWATLPEAARVELLATIDPGANAPDGTAVLRHTANGHCIHLTSGRLCAIQQQHGHDFLPGTCRFFPRLGYESGARGYLSASLSCPEIARRVLSGTGPAGLFESADPPAPEGEPAPADIIGETLAGFVDAVVVDTRFPVRTGVVLLADTLAQAARLSAAGRLDAGQLHALCSAPAARLAMTEARLNAPVPATLDAQRRGFWPWLLQLATERGVRLPANTAALLAAANATGETPFPGHAAARRRLDSHGRAVMASYLRLSFINHGFPVAPYNGNHVATFLQAVLPFATVHLALWAQIADRDGLDDEAIWRTVQHVERRFAHSHALYQLFDRRPGLLQLETYLPVLADL